MIGDGQLDATTVHVLLRFAGHEARIARGGLARSSRNQSRPMRLRLVASRASYGIVDGNNHG